MEGTKPDLIVVRGAGAPDAYATIAIANIAYAASQNNRDIELFQTRSGNKRSNHLPQRFVQQPTLLPYPEAQNHFRYVFGYNNARSTQVIMQDAAKSNLVFFFGYALLDEEMERLLEINPNVYVFDYHKNMLSPKVRRKLCMYQHDPHKCAAQLAWDFFVPSQEGNYPLLVNEVAFSIFDNKPRERELFFGLTACPFQAPHWVKLLGSDLRSEIHTILQRGQFFIDYHKVLQSQILDSATIVRFEDDKAIQKQLVSKTERSSDNLVIYMFQCPTTTAHYFMRCIKDKELPIAKRSLVIAYNHHIRERVYHYVVSSNCGLDIQGVLGYNQNDESCVSRNGAYLGDQGWFTSNTKPQMLLNYLVNRIPTLVEPAKSVNNTAT